MQGGGMIDFTGATASPNLYDCVWVIKRHSSNNKADGVVLRLTEVLLGDGQCLWGCWLEVWDWVGWWWWLWWWWWWCVCVCVCV